MHLPRVLTALSAASALALVLAGCAGSDTDADDDTSVSQDTPLTPYFDALYGSDLSPEDQERQYAEQQARRDELVTACMQEQGFEYTPDTQGNWFSAGDDVVYEPDDRDWVAQYGYGAVNSPYNELPGWDQEYVDPNADYLETLSESEQTAFYDALYGAPPTDDQLNEDGSYDYDWTTAGCQGAADNEVNGEDPAQSDEFAALFESINDLYADIASWPGMAELEAEWSACMDAAGRPGFATQAEAQESFYDELNALYSAGDPGPDVEITEDFVYPEPDPAALEALGEEEIALALVDLDCREDTDYRARYAAAQTEVEEQFIADNRTELDALLAAAEQQD